MVFLTIKLKKCITSSQVLTKQRHFCKSMYNMIKVADVSLFLDGSQILSSLCLDLKAHRTHVLLGPSGCGKSTLLKIILGIYTPSKGKVFIDGVFLNPKNQRQFVQKMGYCVQDGGLFPSLTARQNILLVPTLRRKNPKKSQEKLMYLLELVQVEEKTLDLYPFALSGGEKQRVALMRALICDPNILLMDEPLGALDPIKRQSLQEELHRIFKTLKKTVIFVTHDIFEASYLSQNVILMSKGSIIQVGPFEDLINSPASQFVSDFIQVQQKGHLL